MTLITTDLDYWHRYNLSSQGRISEVSLPLPMRRAPGRLHRLIAKSLVASPISSTPVSFSYSSKDDAFAARNMYAKLQSAAGSLLERSART